LGDDSGPMSAYLDNVCIVGNLNVDLIISEVPRLPEWGKEVFGSSHRVVSSGQAGYLALALSRLGVPTTLVSNVGQDYYGSRLLKDLRSEGVDVSAVEVSEGSPTGVTVAIVRADGERAFVSGPGSLRDFDEQLVLRHWSHVEAARCVCLVGLFNLPALSLGAAELLMASARHSGKTTMLDTGWDPDNWSPDTVSALTELLRQVTIFMPNQDEAHAITGERDPAAAARTLLGFGPELVVVKCGAQGSFALSRSESVSLPALPVQVCDAVGAGDVFDGGFLYALSRNWPVRSCLAFGNAAASLYISRVVHRFPTSDEVRAAAKAYGTELLGGGQGSARGVKGYD
jgi:sugar/nucleoside kinase (ribokinase family)